MRPNVFGCALADDILRNAVCGHTGGVCVCVKMFYICVTLLVGGVFA